MYYHFLSQKACTLAVLVSMAAGASLAMEPVNIIDQGSFAAGGTVVTAKTVYDPMQPKAEGQTLHGAGQFSRTWDTTPDGRDGYRNIFLEAGYPVYLVDQPRRGTAGRSTVAGKMGLGRAPGSPDADRFNGEKLRSVRHVENDE